jgi:hypothetical protein
MYFGLYTIYDNWKSPTHGPLALLKHLAPSVNRHLCPRFIPIPIWNYPQLIYTSLWTDVTLDEVRETETTSVSWMKIPCSGHVDIPCSGHVHMQICGKASDWTVLNYLNNIWQMKIFNGNNNNTKILNSEISLWRFSQESRFPSGTRRGMQRFERLEI